MCKPAEAAVYLLCFASRPRLSVNLIIGNASLRRPIANKKIGHYVDASRPGDVTSRQLNNIYFPVHLLASLLAIYSLTLSPLMYHFEHLSGLHRRAAHTGTPHPVRLAPESAAWPAGAAESHR